MPVAIGAAENTFANPIGLLSDCHRRIERFLQALSAVAAQAPCGRLDATHRSALEAGLKYFREAAPKHTADEEEDLFPALRLLKNPRISNILEDMDRLESEHKIAGAWHREVDEICRHWLDQDCLPAQEAAHLRQLLASLSDLYQSHLAVEEKKVFPVAEAELSSSAKQALGRRMASRRGSRLRAMGSRIPFRLD